MRPFYILSSALLCSSAASAWSLSDSALAEVFGNAAVAMKRDPQAQTLGVTGAQSPNPTDSITTPAASPSSSKNSATTDGDSSDSASGSSDGSGSSSGASKTSNKASSTKTSATTFDPALPAGGVSMITPNIQTVSYYKIGYPVTFVWNYTSLSVTPTAIDVLATCTVNQHYYTLAVNQTVNGSTGAVTWDTSQQTDPALLTAKYTLVIYDAAKAVSAAASAGYFGTYNSFTFNMYAPGENDTTDGLTCLTCSGAMTAIERQSLAVVGMMATFAVLGATWFTGGFGALL